MAEKYEVEYSIKADEDLDSILHYHLSNSGKNAAIVTFNEIRRRIDAALTMPEAYPLYQPGRREFKKVYRYIIAKKIYRIIYTIKVEAKMVRIVRIAHMRSDNGRMIMALEEE